MARGSTGMLYQIPRSPSLGAFERVVLRLPGTIHVDPMRPRYGVTLQSAGLLMPAWYDQSDALQSINASQHCDSGTGVPGHRRRY